MKNTQKGFIVPLLVIIIVALVVGGGVYVYEINKQVASDSLVTTVPTTTTTNPSVTTTQNNSATQTNNIPKTQTQTPTPVANNFSLKTYTDTANGFSIQYPTSLKLQTTNLGPADYSRSSTNPTAQQLLSITSGSETLTIGVSPDPTDVGNCMVTPQWNGNPKPSTVQINGVSFLKYTEGDAAMGQRSSDTIYHTVKNNRCYSITEEIRSYAEDRLSTQAAIDQRNALAASAAQLDPVVQSFKFTPNTANVSTPPTCTLSSDKPTYALGDVIRLTWNSTNASSAVWNQPFDSNSGLRKVMMPPEGTPGVSGAASTVANIEGYQPINLQVVGPGGFGTCSTHVQVNHSSAVPSITINSGVIKQATSQINSSKMTVYITGTATNGALYNDAINLVLVDPNYAGPFDEASIYKGTFGNNLPWFYTGGTTVDLRTDSMPFETWQSSDTYLNKGITQVRVLAYPFYSSSVNAPTQPLINKVITISQ